MAIALGALLAGAACTWFVGEDVNWDWQNYHEYNVWAVITGRSIKMRDRFITYPEVSCWLPPA